MANTEYSFQIRGVFGDQEGQYGPINDDIRTKQSLATTLLDFTVLLAVSYTHLTLPTICSV